MRIPPKLSVFQPRGINICLFHVAQASPYDYALQSTETPDDEPARIIGMRKIEPEMVQKQLMIDLLNARMEYKVTYQQIFHRFPPQKHEEPQPMEDLDLRANAKHLGVFEPVRREILMRRLLLPVMNDDSEVHWVYSVARHMGVVNIEFVAAEWSA